MQQQAKSRFSMNSGKPASGPEITLNARDAFNRETAEYSIQRLSADTRTSSSSYVAAIDQAGSTENLGCNLAAKGSKAER